MFITSLVCKKNYSEVFLYLQLKIMIVLKETEKRFAIGRHNEDQMILLTQV